jgi:hypothetical protein
MATNLIQLQAELRKTTLRSAKEAIDEEREVADSILGVDVVLKYEGTQGRGTVMVYSGVFLAGERFGTEYEVIPWNIFKNPSTWYSCADYMLKHQAEAVIKRAKVSDATVVEEPYPADVGPIRYHFHVGTLNSVVKLWKTLKKTKLSDL